MNKRLLKYFTKTFMMLALLLFLIPSKASAAGYDYKTGYGGQLSEVQKGMYDAMVSAYVNEALADASTESAKYNCGFGNYVVSMTDFYTDVEYAFHAFIYDYPQVFWAGKPGVSVMATQPDENTIDVYSVTFTFEEDFEGAREDISAYNEKIKAVAGGIYKTAEQKVTVNSEEKLVYECYLGIHDWLCENLTYNYDALNDSSSYPQAYTSGPVFAGDASVICQGYSEAFKALCDIIRYYYDVELYAASVVGNTTGNARHMWNYAYMPDGNWYGIDVQWDDQDVLNHTYFLCGSQTKGYDDTFAKEHVEKQYFSTNSAISYIYPVIAENAYEHKENSGDYYKEIRNSNSGVTESALNLYDGEEDIVLFELSREKYYGSDNEQPIVEEYIFSGWFSDEACTVPFTGTEGKAYAKFVDLDVLKVMAQASVGIRDMERGKLRFLSTVDSANYANVGFHIEFNGKTLTQELKNVYKKFYAVKSDGSKKYYEPTIASPISKYFIAYTLTGVPQAAHDVPFNVTPYWTTLDGTYVEGIETPKVISSMNGY